MQTFFAQERISNPATQAHLAERTFSGAAAVWIAEHRKLRPKLLLSWSQLKELVKMEQLPDIDAGAAFRKWNALTYDGDIEAYIKKVAELRLSHPISPRDSYICGAQPLSSSLAAKIQSLTRRSDMTPPEWEEMLRVYVLKREEEGRPVGAKKTSPCTTCSSGRGRGTFCGAETPLRCPIWMGRRRMDGNAICHHCVHPSRILITKNRERSSPLLYLWS